MSNQSFIISLPDGTKKEYFRPIKAMDVALEISEGLARNVLAAKVNGKTVDVSMFINFDAALELLTWKDSEGKATLWHSSAHLMAEALESLYPGIKLGIGPAIDNGFYYDVDFGEIIFDGEQLFLIEEKMLELARQKSEFLREPISKQEAVKYFEAKDDEYKLELIENLKDGAITFYTQGNFTDLCKGPHIPHTGFIKAVKILNIAGAYWRGDEKRKQLTRLYGISFPKQKELKEYLALLEEAKKRDHRKIGQELGFFTFSQKVGKGLPLWLPKGAALRERLESFLKKAQLKAGYDPVITPHIGGKELYVTSGHYEKYGKDSFQSIHTPSEDEEFLLKPMNCPHHCEIYKSQPRSYKDLPVRFAEFGTVYRYEQSGELHGLTRVRGFTQDDAHIFCRSDQLEEEFSKVIDLTLYVLKALGFPEFTAQISLRDLSTPEKYIGTDENWYIAENAIKKVAKDKRLDTVLETGEAAFYGPKLDFMVKDAIGRKWQLGTIQVDYTLPERFKLEYIGADNQKYRPVMIHRAPFGSLERFIAILIENTAGNLPIWLAPEQFVVLPISEKYHNYAKNVFIELQKYDFNGFIDRRDEKIGKKIRDAEIKKIPFMLILGEKEAVGNTLSVRAHGTGDLGSFSFNKFLEMFKTKIEI